MLAQSFWRLMGVASFLLYYTIATFAPFLWDEWLGSRQLMNLSALPFAVRCKDCEEAREVRVVVARAVVVETRLGIE